MPLHKAPNVEPIRGYRLIEPLGKGGFGEVWKCEAPGGIFKAIKFVYGDLNGLESQRFRAEEELRAFQLIKSIRHPFLLSIDRVENVDGELIIITELADQNLHELHVACREQGLPGIARAELLGYLRETAEVLDLMNQKFDLQHLDVKPRNLFLVSNHVKVADFGLVNRLAPKDVMVQTSAITPLYAAPELFENKMSRQCDQYSLAIVFQELLTGTRPFVGDNPRQLMLLHVHGLPDLSALSDGDRAIVAKALAKKPDERYPSCLALVRALSGETLVPMPLDSLSDINLGKDADTLHNQGGETLHYSSPPKPAAAPLPPDVLPGFHFVECISASPLQDVWRTRDPDGGKRLVKIVYGFTSGGKGMQDAVVQLKSIHHPALVLNEVARVEPGRLVLVTDPVKETLRERFQQCLDRKERGIVRGELMGYLRAAAEVLDYLYQQYGLNHLNLHPRQLILDHGWLQIAEFGLAPLLWLPAGQDVAARNARYAAPELFDGGVGRAADQYSLALIFAEMLTGTHPFHGLGLRARRTQAPDLERLPPVDREVITRALHADPQARWPSCTEMMLALEGTSLEKLRELEQQEDRFTQLIASSKSDAALTPIAAGTAGDLNEILLEIFNKAGGSTLVLEKQIAPVFRDDSIEHTFQACIPLGAAHTKLGSFAQPWFGEVIRDDDQGVAFRISLPTSFWRKLFRKPVGLQVSIRLARANSMSATPIKVTTTVAPLRKKHPASRKLLNELGPQIIDSLQAMLQSEAVKRSQDRLLWPHPLKVTPIRANGSYEEAIECRGKDISRSGIGFYLPHDLNTSDVLIELPNDIQPPSIAIPATLVRAKRCPDGWYEVGALFRLPALRKSLPEINLPPAQVP
jgi:serine/threonine protein kinase